MPDILIGVGVGDDVGVGVGAGVGVGVGVVPPEIVITPLVWLASYEFKLSSMNINSLPWHVGAHVKGDEPVVFVD